MPTPDALAVLKRLRDRIARGEVRPQRWEDPLIWDHEDLWGQVFDALHPGGPDAECRCRERDWVLRGLDAVIQQMEERAHGT